jgi:hypothetical protein
MDRASDAKSAAVISPELNSPVYASTIESVAPPVFFEAFDSRQDAESPPPSQRLYLRFQSIRC